MQVLRLGSPVTSLSLAPAMDMLATTHVEREGVYLWANQLIFGSGADIIPSEKAIDARLPTVRTGFVPGEAAAPGQEEGTAGIGKNSGKKMSGKGRGLNLSAMLRYSSKAAQRGVNDDVMEDEEDLSASDSDGDLTTAADSALDDSDLDDSSDEEDRKNTPNGRVSKEGADADGTASISADPAAGAAYSRKDAAGAPLPLAPEMVTLSLLPRTQWLNLVHLDTIKARNKPIEAPEKPKAAPFFLPTLPSEANAGRNPIFDPSAGLIDLETEADEATKAAATAAWGDGGSEDDEAGRALIGDASIEGEDEAGRGRGLGLSRVLRSGGGVGGAARKSRVIELLHSCADAGDWTSLMGHLRGLAPVHVDRELRSMQLLDESTLEEERDVELLFMFLEAEAASNSNFEFTQALLRATLNVHGEAVASRPGVAAAAARVEARLNATWHRLSNTLQHVRCIVGLLGSLQA